MIARLNYY